MQIERQLAVVMAAVTIAVAAICAAAYLLYAGVSPNAPQSNQYTLAGALVTSGLALAGVALNLWLGGRSQRSLEELKAQLADDNSAASAKRQYEYQALQRLYTDVEPTLFAIHEAVEEAHYRVRGLARDDRGGSLGTSSKSWINKNDYYLRTTIYRLLVPAVQFRLLQRRITFVDLRLDETILLRYRLMKLFSRSYTDDFDLARTAVPEKAEALRYSPNGAEAARRAADEPEEFSRQGLVVGDLENICDAFIVHDKRGSRAASFAEAEAVLTRHPQPADSVSELIDVFKGFDPRRKPVLARLLTAQGCLSELVLSTYATSMTPESLCRKLDQLIADSDFIQLFTWQGNTNDLAVAREYLTPRLKALEDPRRS